MCEFISRLGCPLSIHTDQGKNVSGNLMHAICDLLEIAKTRTTPYRPSANGQVERYNRLLLQTIRCTLERSQIDWDKHLSLLAGAICSMEHRQTGFSANMLMLGREVLKPVDIVFDTASANIAQREPAEHVLKLRQALESVHNLARKQLKMAQCRQKRTYDLKLSKHQYSPGDLVYKMAIATNGQHCKLSPTWAGPFLVTQVLSSVLYRLKSRNKEVVAHYDRLKLCQDRVIPIWMRH